MIQAPAACAPGAVFCSQSSASSPRAAGGPSIVGYHLLLGVQANLWRLKVFAQGTIEPFGAAAISFGTRIAL